MTVCSIDGNQQQDYMDSWRTLFRDAYLEEDKAFAACILEDTEPRVTARDGKMAVLVVNAGNLSIREKRIVQIRDGVLF